MAASHAPCSGPPDTRLVPELPDVTVDVDSIASRIVDQSLLKLRLGNPFVLRTVEPSPGIVAIR